VQKESAKGKKYFAKLVFPKMTTTKNTLEGKENNNQFLKI
jgi:hypothetical protein